jgi:hypothetical protein
VIGYSAGTDGSVEETVSRLRDVIDSRDPKLFGVIDATRPPLIPGVDVR